MSYEDEESPIMSPLDEAVCHLSRIHDEMGRIRNEIHDRRWDATELKKQIDKCDGNLKQILWAIESSEKEKLDKLDQISNHLKNIHSLAEKSSSNSNAILQTFMLESNRTIENVHQEFEKVHKGRIFGFLWYVGAIIAAIYFIKN
jgi:chromosome segregation ATPase